MASVVTESFPADNQMTREERRRLRKERREKRDVERRESGSEIILSPTPRTQTSSSSPSLLSPHSPHSPLTPEPVNTPPTTENFESGEFSFAVKEEGDSNRTILDREAYVSYSQHIRRASGASSSQHILEAQKSLLQPAEYTSKQIEAESEILHKTSETTLSERREQYRQHAEESKSAENHPEQSEVIPVPVKKIKNQYIAMATTERKTSDTEKPDIHVNLEETKSALGQHQVETKRYIEDEEMLSNTGSGLNERTQKLFSYAEGKREDGEEVRMEEEEDEKPSDSLSNIKQRYIQATVTGPGTKAIDIERDILNSSGTSLRDRTTQFQSRTEAVRSENEERRDEEQQVIRSKSPVKKMTEQFLTAAQQNGNAKHQDDELVGLRRSGSVRGAKMGLEQSGVETKKYSDPELQSLSGTVSQTTQGWGKSSDQENKKHKDEDLANIQTSVSQVKSQYGKTDYKAKKYIEDDEDLQNIRGRIGENAKESLYKSEKKATKYIEQDEALQNMSQHVGEAKVSLYKSSSKPKKYIEDEEGLSNMTGTVSGTKETFVNVTPSKSKKYIEEDEDILVTRGTVSSSMMRLKASTDETKKYNTEEEELTKIRSPVEQRKQMFLQSCVETKKFQTDPDLEGFQRSGSVSGAKEELQHNVLKTKKYVEEDTDLQEIDTNLSQKLESLHASHKPTHKYIEEEDLSKLSEYVQETQENLEYNERSTYMDTDPELSSISANIQETKESLKENANKPLSKRYIDEDPEMINSPGYVSSTKTTLSSTTKAAKKYIEEDPDLVPGQVGTTKRSLSQEATKGYRKYIEEDEDLHQMSPGLVSGSPDGHYTAVNNGTTD